MSSGTWFDIRVSIRAGVPDDSEEEHTSICRRRNSATIDSPNLCMTASEKIQMSSGPPVSRPLAGCGICLEVDTPMVVRHNPGRCRPVALQSPSHLTVAHNKSGKHVLRYEKAEADIMAPVCRVEEFVYERLLKLSG